MKGNIFNQVKQSKRQFSHEVCFYVFENMRLLHMADSSSRRKSSNPLSIFAYGLIILVIVYFVSNTLIVATNFGHSKPVSKITISDLSGDVLVTTTNTPPLREQLDRLIDNRKKESLPNIIVILADDYGWDDVSYHNNDNFNPNNNINRVSTPNLDAFINERGSIELNQFYTQCMCTPARGALLTGRYPIHNGLNRMVGKKNHEGLPLEQWTISQLLKKYKNYDTYLVGKWHVGFWKYDYTPTFRGFDQFYGYYTGGMDYWRHTRANKYNLRKDLTPNCGYNCTQYDFDSKGIYSMNLFSDYVIDNILPKYSKSFSSRTNSYGVGIGNTNNRNKNKNKNKNDKNPFFLYYPLQSVHEPQQAPEYYINLPQNKQRIKSAERQTFAGMVSVLDDTIGNLTKALKKFGLFDNTIIVFASDNGAPSLHDKQNIGGRNFPLRGGKRSIYEGGTRVPAIMYIPPKYYYTSSTSDDQIAIGQRVMYNNIFHISDVLPTILDIVNIDLNEIGLIDNDVLFTNKNNMIYHNDNKYHFDGVSHWKSLIYSIHGLTDIVSLVPVRNSFYYGTNLIKTRSAIRWNNYKLISWFGYIGNQNQVLLITNLTEEEQLDYFASWNQQAELHPRFKLPLPFAGYIDPQTMIGYQLYDLSKDPSEINDISLQNVDLTKQLISMLNDIEKTTVPFHGYNHECDPLPPYPQDAMGPTCK